MVTQFLFFLYRIYCKYLYYVVKHVSNPIELLHQAITSYYVHLAFFLILEEKNLFMTFLYTLADHTHNIYTTEK